MKTKFSNSLWFIFVVCVVLAFPVFARDRWLTLPPGWGQQPAPPDPLAEARKQEAEARKREAERARAELEDKRKIIESNLENVGPDAYRKYSDGSVAYLGLLLYMRDGLITNSGPAYAYLEKMVVIDTGYRVEDVGDGGCRIMPLKSSAYQDHGNDCFVVGLKGFRGRQYLDVLMVRKIGSYNYTTVTGASRRIPKCELGERATKEEYTEFFWKKRR